MQVSRAAQQGLGASEQGSTVGVCLWMVLFLLMHVGYDQQCTARVDNRGSRADPSGAQYEMGQQH